MNNTEKHEKVIKGLKYLHDVLHWSLTESEQDTMIRRNITKEAIELLKAQEPVAPIERNGFYYCGECRYAFTVHKQKYCTDCGRPVKWE